MTRKTLNAGHLDFGYIFQISLYWHALLPHLSTTYWKLFLYLIFQATHIKPFPFFQERHHDNIHNKFLYSIYTSLSASPELVFPFIDKTNSCPTHQTPSLSLTKISPPLSFHPLAFFSTYTTLYTYNQNILGNNQSQNCEQYNHFTFCIARYQGSH